MIDWIIFFFLYSTILCFQADSLCTVLSSRLTVLVSHVILNEWLYPVTVHSLISTEVVYWQHYSVITWLVPHETAAISVHVLCAQYKFTTMHQISVIS